MSPAPAALRTLLGEHPGTRALRTGAITSSLLDLQVADVAVPNRAFKRVVRDLEFDVAELALMTFLMARSRGVPLRLFPVVLFSRNPLPYVVCRADTPLGPRDLAGRRVGVRAYTTTTAVWVRALLADRCGLDADRVQWVTIEEGHVADWRDPPNVNRDPARTSLVEMLLAGEIDAAIVDPVPADPRARPVVPDAEAACAQWERESGARAINHVVVVGEAIANDRTLATELYRMFRESRDLAVAGGFAPPPVGLAAHHRSLAVAIETAQSQRLLAQPLAVRDLVTDVLASLA